MNEQEYVLKYKHKGAIVTIRAAFSGNGFLERLWNIGIPVDRNLPVLLEKVKEFFNSGLQKRQITLLISKTPFVDRETELFLSKVVGDVFSAKTKYQNGRD